MNYLQMITTYFIAGQREKHIVQNVKMKSILMKMVIYQIVMEFITTDIRLNIMN